MTIGKRHWRIVLEFSLDVGNADINWGAKELAQAIASGLIDDATIIAAAPFEETETEDV